jgi:thymidylate synthase
MSSAAPVAPTTAFAAAFHPEHRYLDLLAEVAHQGRRVDGRNGAVRRLTGRMLRFDLAEGLPVLTTKRLHVRSIVEELFWFIRGETRVQPLQAAGVTIWDEWADADGFLGPIYGHQWRAWGAFPRLKPQPFAPGDQLARALQTLRDDPHSRRMLVSAWNVEDLPDMALPPCHFAFQFHVDDGRVSTMVHQRSADVFLGLPFNLASYGILTHLAARIAGLEVGEVIFALGDVHLYESHLDAALEQLSRQPAAPFPTLAPLPQRPAIDDYKPADVAILAYISHPAIRAEVVA